MKKLLIINTFLFVALSQIMAQQKVKLRGHITRITSSSKIILNGGFDPVFIDIDKDGNFSYEFELEEEQSCLVKTDSTVIVHSLWLADGTYDLELEEKITKYSKRPELFITKIAANPNTMLRFYADTLFLRKGFKPEALLHAKIKVIDSIFSVSNKSPILPEVIRLSQRIIGDSLALHYANLYKGETGYKSLQLIVKVANRNELVQKKSTFKSFPMADLRGKVFDFESLRVKKFILIDLWSSSCGPCRKNHIKLKEMYRLYKEKGLEIVSISLDKDKKAWHKAVAADGMDWINISDLKGYDSPFAKYYSITSLPFNFLLDSNFKILDTGLYDSEILAFLDK